jgi:hypothetical protein
MFITLYVYGHYTKNWHNPLTFRKPKVPLYKIHDRVLIEGAILGEVTEVSVVHSHRGKNYISYRVCYLDPIELGRLPCEISGVDEKDLSYAGIAITLTTYAILLRDHYIHQYEREHESQPGSPISGLDFSALSEILMSIHPEKQNLTPLTRHQLIEDES